MSSTWDPDWVISPGETLRDWLDENHLSANVAARTCRMGSYELRGILEGRLKIDRVRAEKLQAGTMIPARLWLNLERQFRQGLAEGKVWVR